MKRISLLSRRSFLKGLAAGVGASGGHLFVYHYWCSVLDIEGIGAIELNIRGTGYAALDRPSEVEEALSAGTANLLASYGCGKLPKKRSFFTHFPHCP